MSRILLLRPPAVFSRSSFCSAVALPVGLAYVAAVLREAGHEVSVLDALGEGVDHYGTAWSPDVLYRGLSPEEIAARVPASVDAVGVSVMFSQDWPHIQDLLRVLRRARPGVPILLGGEHASAAAAFILADCPEVDFVARGEGETVALQFAEFLDGRRSVEEVAGLSWRQDDGGVVHNPPAARLRSADHLPWPAWDLFPLDAYFRTGEGHGVERGRTLTMLATRGCPYQCTFCSSPSMWTTRYVMRDVAKVVDEMEHYVRAYRAENIDFSDLTAVVRKGWILDLCREIRRRGLTVSWQLPSGTRSEALDDEVLGAMREAGCNTLTYAPESGSERTLSAIKKRVRLSRMFESIRAAKRRGMFVKCNFVIGFPKETRVDVWRTLWTALRLIGLGIDDISIYPFTPYPGSELFEDLRRSGRIPRLDRAYFESLMAITNFKVKGIYCERIGPRELALYHLGGLALCYGLSYLLFPSRLLRTWRNWRTRRSDTLLENRLFAYLRRRRRMRELSTVH